MKRAYIALVLLLLLSVGCTLLSRRLTAASEELSARTDALQEAIRLDNPDGRSYALEQLLQSWQNRRSFLIALSGHTNCEPIETVIASLPVWAAAGDDPQLLAALAQLDTHLDQLHELQSAKLSNLF